MRSGTFLAILIAAFLLSTPLALLAGAADSGSAAQGYEKKSCTCKCLVKGQSGDISAATLAKKGADLDILCQQQCARTCGGFTDCPTDEKKACGDCCTGFCNSNYGGSDKATCQTSCKSACDFRKLVDGILSIVYAAAGIVGALMLVIHGIRLAVSKDPAGREAAKSSMWHVIIALLIIALAGTMVNMFITIGGLVSGPATPGGGGGGTPAPGATTTPPADQGGLISASATYDKSTDTVSIKATFENKYAVSGEYNIVVTDALDSALISRVTDYVTVNSGEKKEIGGTISGASVLSKVSPDADNKVTLGIKLVRKDPAEGGTTKEGFMTVPLTGLASTVQKIDLRIVDQCTSSEASGIPFDDSEIRIKVEVQNSGDKDVNVGLSVLGPSANMVYNEAGWGVVGKGSKKTFDIDTGGGLGNPFWSYSSVKNGYYIRVQDRLTEETKDFGMFNVPRPIGKCA